MEIYFGYPGKSAQNKILEARLCRAGDCDCISIATQSGRHPENINLVNGSRIPPSDCATGSDRYHLYSAQAMALRKRANLKDPESVTESSDTMPDSDFD
jgi:hypothetical protein